ncbi:MAG: S41 family peptidase [Chitinispirillaceae bacterium]|nr:S41 family peptidase [Chitinispirillaceae bacterium]
MSSNLFRSFFWLCRKPPVIGFAVLTVIFAGLLVDVSTAGGERDNFYADIVRFDDVATKIHQNYVEDMKFGDIIDSGVNGMLRMLDPHTTYMNEKEYSELKIHLQGRFGGLGIQIAIRDKVLSVMTPITGTPASRAGIQPGDQIIKIDGKSTAGITIDRAVSKLRGEPGTKVALTIRRKGEPKDMEYVITRGIIEIKAVPFYGVIDSAIGYINFSQFSEKAEAEVAKAIRELLKKNIRGLILDMRWNPGGLLPQAVDVAGLFLPRGSLVVSTRGRSLTIDQNRDFPSMAEPVLPVSTPLVMLVNYASASASEIVAGAIQDWDRGVVVGDTTFGKGSVQTPIPLDKKYTLKLTTAYYYTPSGRCINRPENAVRGSAHNYGYGDADADTALSDSTGDAQNDRIKAKADTTRYFTKNGRVVFGGGGIIPDTVVQQEVTHLAVRALFGKDIFFRFANHEYAFLKKKNRIRGGKISLDDEIMKDFYRFLDSVNFSYESIAQIQFREFKRRSELAADTSADSAKLRRIVPGLKPKWTAQEMAELKKFAGAIDSVLSRENRRTLAENEKEIRKHLYEALLIRHLGQDDEAFYRWRLSDDPVVKTAVRFLANKDIYSSLIKPRAEKAPAGNGKE